MDQRKEEKPSRFYSEPEMSDLAQAVLEEIGRDVDRKEEVEAYVHELKSQFYREKEKFKSRFLKGYETLLQILETKS